MTMNNLFAKLRKYQRKSQAMLFFCIVLSVLLVTSYAMMYFSSTLQKILPPGGDTSKQAIMIFAVAVAGCAIFTTYASSLFLRGKSREMGLFLALGAPRGLLKRELFQEIVYLSLSGCAAGMLLSVPVSMGIWRLFRLFIIDTKEMVYRPGASGGLWGLVFSVCVTAAIFVMAVGYVNRTNVIEILNTHRIAEPVPQVKGYYAGVGIALMLAGMVLGFAVPQLCIRYLRFVLPPVWNVTYLLCLAGLYLVMVYLVVHARRGRKPDKYYRHIISTSMMRFMGRQTVRNMCVAAMLVFGALFASFYVPVLISGLRENIRLNPVDYSFHSREAEARISEEEIRGLASEHGAAVRDYRETGGVRLIVDGLYQDWLPSGRIEETYREKIGMENFVSESAFRAMSGEEIDVPAESFLAVVTDNMSALSQEDTMLISDPVTEESRSFKNAGQVIFNDNITNSYGPVFYVLDDADYRYYADSLPEEYRLRFVLFNVDNWEDSYAFADALKKEILQRTSEEAAVHKYYDEYQEEQAAERGEKDSVEETSLSGETLELSADNNLLYVNWKYYPNFKVLAMQDALKNVAVMTMLFVYIAVICFAAIGVISYTRGVTIAETQRQVFVDLRKLGADDGYIRFCMAGQLNKIFAYPYLIGTTLLFVFYCFVLYQNDGRISGSEAEAIAINAGIALVGAVYLYMVYRLTCAKFKKVIR